MDYALSNNGGKSWKGLNGKIVVFNGITEARKAAQRIANKTDNNITIGRVTWAKDYRGGKMGIQKVTRVETVKPATLRPK